jgi:dTMP kinase
MKLRDIKGRPKFISFEGTEGCGKTTQSKLLSESLISEGCEVLYTREPGGTVLGEDIRRLLLSHEMSPMSELMLVVAARIEHLKREILPSLASGKWVICDRFVDSTACYQGYRPEIGIDAVFELHNKTCDGILPDITIFIDIPPDKSLLRICDRSDNNKFDKRPRDFHQSIYCAFKDLALRFPDRIYSIEASDMSVEELRTKVLNLILSIS